ncbi:MAG TPA: substrate-binding domain-containing protein [Flavobacterium sp.]
MKTIKIVGVPEHFNYPWQLAKEQGAFEKEGIDLQWTNIPEGTGKMCRMLREGETDLAVILTEGIVKDIADGNLSKIVQVYVETPLIWGIHVDAKSEFQALTDLENTKAAISRYGSGSHLMAYINAQKQNWNPDNLTFEIVNTIDGAVEALSTGKADYFMWERFMTKPLVDNGTFRRVADCPTPWPCFVIAARNGFLEHHPSEIEKILSVINSVTKTFKTVDGIEKTLAATFAQKEEDIKEWLSLTEWSQKHLSEDMLNKVQNQLFDLSLIDKKATFTDIVKA